MSATSARPDIRTPVTLLTGFLGAGKTTLLNRILTAPGMARTAVVINEFGEVAIDHALTTASDDTILVLENGCLCCTVFGDLVQTLNRLWHAREAGEIAFDQVVIETSGLAEPAPILQAFLSEPTLEGLFRVAATVAVADAVNASSTLDEHPVSVRQIALADAILVTKLDMLPEPERELAATALAGRLASLNRSAAFVRADAPDFDPVALLGAASDPARDPRAAARWFGSEAQHGREHDHGHEHASGIVTFALVRDEPLTQDALNLLLSSLERYLGPALLRVKGLVQVAEEPDRPAVIQGAQHLIHNLVWLDRWPDDDRRTRLVFITQDVPSTDLEEMVTLLDRVARRTAEAKRRGDQARSMSD